MDLSIGKGETVALVGETGCGKTVTAKAILGILPIPPAEITKGEILFGGVNLLNLDEKQISQVIGKRMSLVPQDPMTCLNPVYTVGEQLLDIMRWQGKKDPGLLRYIGGRFRREKNPNQYEKAVNMLESLLIASPREVMKRYPVELSGGMRQRVLIGMALINDPEFLIADEPGTALDVTVQDQILDLLKSLIETKNLSVLYITHNLGVARNIASRVYVMYAGRIAETAPTDKLFQDPRHPYTIGLLESVPKLSGMSTKGIMGRMPDFGNPPKGCRFHPRCAHVKEVCMMKRPEMLEVDTDHLVACHLYQ
ncbi:MAG: ABC transporter ATP-binding protein [Candidatus Bathyarchaeia archaeon]